MNINNHKFPAIVNGKQEESFAGSSGGENVEVHMHGSTWDLWFTSRYNFAYKWHFFSKSICALNKGSFFPLLQLNVVLGESN